MAASALSLSSVLSLTSVFSEISPVPHIYFFHLKSFLWKGPLTVKVRKKIIDQILGYISFCIEIRAYLGYLLCKKRHKNWNQECKQKQSLLFNLCNVFDLLTSRTPKIAWWLPVFKPDFYIFSFNEQLRKI